MTEIIRDDFRIPYIKKHITLITNLITKLKLDGINNPVQYEMKIIELFPEFYDDHSALIKRLCRGDDITKLNRMFECLELVQSGNRSLAATELELGEELAKDMLYPSLGIKK